jgi:hypothetical protein
MSSPLQFPQASVVFSSPSSPASISPPPKDNSTLFCCCLVCYERYQIHGLNEPRVLSCGHTLCFNCLQSLYLSNLQRCCPFCKSHLKLTHPNLFPKNFYLLDILQEQFSNERDFENSHSSVTFSNRISLAKMQCEYERTLLEQSRKEIIEYDRLRYLAETQIKDIERLSREAYGRLYESHDRLDRNIMIMKMLHSSQELCDQNLYQYQPEHDQYLQPHSSLTHRTGFRYPAPAPSQCAVNDPRINYSGAHQSESRRSPRVSVAIPPSRGSSSYRPIAPLYHHPHHSLL